MPGLPCKIREKRNTLEMRMVIPNLWRIFMVIWLLLLIIVSVVEFKTDAIVDMVSNAWLKYTSFSGETIGILSTIIVFGMFPFFLGFLFAGLLKMLQISICLDETGLVLGRSKKKKWKLADIQNISCQNRSVVIETSHSKVSIISPKMGFPKKKLLSLANYLNDKIQEMKNASL